MMRLLSALLPLVVASALAQQGTPSHARPAYEIGSGPVVAFDEAHKNTHTCGSRDRATIRGATPME